MPTSRVIFWDVDTQYDFMKADGKLYVPDAEQLIPNLKKLTDFALFQNLMELRVQILLVLGREDEALRSLEEAKEGLARFRSGEMAHRKF